MEPELAVLVLFRTLKSEKMPKASLPSILGIQKPVWFPSLIQRTLQQRRFYCRQINKAGVTMTEYYRPTKAVIDLGAIKKNLTAFQERSRDAEVIAVVKADADGHGVLAVAKTAIENGVRLLAVATPDEALFLREEGIDTELLILGATPPNFIPVAQQRNIIVTAVSLDWLSMAATQLMPD